MNLPIKWRVLPGPYTGYQMIHAGLSAGGTRYDKQMVMPAAFSKATWWLTIAAMKAEIENAVGGEA
jgi:hypothetical protein